jgi:hypothetical protein
MAKDHGARQQKRMAKHKAKRSAKRALLLRRDSKDPNIRLQGAERWPIVGALVGTELWSGGIGYLCIARQGSDGELIFAAYLVDVYCLGVKNAFWRTGTRKDFEDAIQHLSQSQRMREIAPACLAKIVKGAVEYAHSFGFSPHPDYHHASMLLDGIDPSTCPEEFTFGRDGKPFYIQGPNETFAQAQAIMQRVQSLGGHYFLQLSGDDPGVFAGLEGESDDFDPLDEDDSE